MTDTSRFAWPIPEWNADWQLWQDKHEDLLNDQDSTVFSIMDNARLVFKQLPNARVYDDSGTIKMEMSSDLLLISRTLNTVITVDSATDLELETGSMIGATVTPGAVSAQDTVFELYDDVASIDPSIQIFGYIDDSYTVNWYNGATLELDDPTRQIFSFKALTGSDSEKVKVSNADTTAGWLDDKIVAGTGIVTTILDPGANETLEIKTTLLWDRTAGTPGYLEVGTASDTLRVGAGSASQPGVACSTDTDTGIYWSESNELLIAANGDVVTFSGGGGDPTIEFDQDHFNTYIKQQKTTSGDSARMNIVSSCNSSPDGAEVYVATDANANQFSIIKLTSTADGGSPSIQLLSDGATTSSGTSEVLIESKGQMACKVEIEANSTGSANAYVELKATSTSGTGYVIAGDTGTDELRFLDVNHGSAAPSWTQGYITFSDAATEWDNYKSDWGEVSLLKAFEQISDALPTPDEKAAMSNADSPSSTNPFITQTGFLDGPYDYENYFIFFDHFVGWDEDYSLLWVSAGDSGDGYALAGLGGVLTISTGTTSGYEAKVYGLNSTESNVSKDPTLRVKVKLVQTSNCKVSLGFYEDSNNYIIFYYDTSVDGNWHTQTCASGTQTDNDTGVAANTSYHTFEIIVSSSGTSIDFNIDDTLETTHTTNIPSTNTKRFMGIETSESASKSMDVDWFFLVQDL